MVVEEVEKNTLRFTDGEYSSYLLTGLNKALLINSLPRSEGMIENISPLTTLPLSLINTSAVSALLTLNDSFSSFYMNPSDSFIYYNRLKRVGIINPLYDGGIVDLGERKIKVISFPGLTPGSIVLLDYSTGSLFSGLSITQSTLHLYESSSDIHALLLSIRRLSQYRGEYDIIYPSAGPSPIGVKIVDEYEDLLSGVIRKNISPENKDGKEYYSSSLVSLSLQ